MTKAFLYDSLCGMVYRCMFAGVDGCGRTQWVNITPGEEPKTLIDYVIDEDLGETHFHVLSMEGETAPSRLVAKVLGKVAEFPVNPLGAELTLAVKQMRELGVKWDKEPLELTFRVFENGENSRRHGTYSFWIEDNKTCCSILADIDGFEMVDDLFWTIRTYMQVMEIVAGISVINKDLRITEKLKKEVKRSDLSMFDRVEIADW